MKENNSGMSYYKVHLSKAERKGLTNREKTLLREKTSWKKNTPNFLQKQ